VRALWPIAALVVLGCEMPALYSPPPPKIGAYRSHALVKLKRPRTLVLPLRHADPEASRQITEALVLELQKSQAVEAISPYGPETEFLKNLTVWRDGALDVRALTTLRKRLGVDAVVAGILTGYRPYEPPLVGLKVQLLSARTGRVLWGAETCLDARDGGVKALMRHYYAERIADGSRSYGWQILLTSPRHFAQFVAHEVVATLAPPEPPVLLSLKPREGPNDGNPRHRPTGPQSGVPATIARPRRGSTQTPSGQ